METCIYPEQLLDDLKVKNYSNIGNINYKIKHFSKRLNILTDRINKLNADVNEIEKTLKKNKNSVGIKILE